MRFKTLYRAFFLIALLADLMDYLITLKAFEKFPAWLETNPYIRLLMQHFTPFIASTIVFIITLALIITAYKLCAGYFNQEPYNSHLKPVWNHLWRSGTVRGRDLAIFASIALYIVFIHMHLTGFLSWLQILQPQLMIPTITLTLSRELILSITFIAVTTVLIITVIIYKKMGKR